MKLKVFDVLNSIEPIRELNNRDDMPIGVSLNLVLASKALEPILNVIDEKQKGLVVKYTTPTEETTTDAEGKETTQTLNKFNSDEDREAYSKAYQELLNEEVEITAKQVDSSKFPETFTISAQKLMALSWLLV